MIFAIATKCSLYLYDTQQKLPFGLISNIHYTRLTDLAWSNDGNTLLVSSTDGYCSIVQFAEGELGIVYKEQSIQEILASKTAKDEPKKKKKKSKKGGKKDDKSPSIEGKENAEEKLDAMEVDQSSPNQLKLNNLPDSIKEKIPVDKIIKSSEIFSPEKQIGSPVTPIQVRKFPRNHDETEASPSRNGDHRAADATTPKTTSYFKSFGPQQIEVRRHPRVLETQKAESPASEATSGSPKSKKKLL